MSRVETPVDASGAIAALGRAASALARRGGGFEALAEAAAQGTDSDVAVIWLPAESGGVEARTIWAVSAGLRAELDGRRSPSLEEAASTIVLALGPEAAELSLPFRTPAGRGAVQLGRVGHRYGPLDELVGTLAADLAALAVRTGRRSPRGVEEAGALELAGEALAAVAEDEGAAGRVARLAAGAAGADAALIWRVRGPAVVVEGSFGPIEVAPRLQQVVEALVAEHRSSDALVEPDGGRILTFQLGQPPLGALQLRFGPGAPPDDQALEQLAGFAVRAAHALRVSERARLAGLELERTRALLAVIGEAISRLSLSHTLETAIERLAELLDADRVAIYLREESRISVAACRGIEGPHEPVAERLLEVALAARQEDAVVEVADAAADERLAAVRAQASEAGIGSALALPLVVATEPIGLLAVYPRGRRRLTENERALLTALAAQLAVAVQNARLHERATALGVELESSLAAERDASERLNAHYEISRSFAQTLSLDRTLSVFGRSIVSLLEVDAAVIRMRDERGVDFVAEAVEVNDERVDAAARALLGRPQQLPRDVMAQLERGRPLVLDAERAESLGGALALLSPFLRKGSSVALIPIATPSELLAVLTIVSLHPKRPVEGAVADTALAIAGQAALAIDNARLYGQQKAFADTMQRALLPREKPVLVGLELGDVYESAARVEVGGDVYDYLTLADGRLAVVLGDVTGHGVDATADMAMAKYVFRSLAREHPEPGRFLAAANEVVTSEIAPGRFITMAALVVDAKRNLVSCASAGHPPPRLVLPNGTVESVAARGLALGIDAPQEYVAVTAEFPRDAIVVAYTDGVIEARRGSEQFGFERLDALLSTSRDLQPQQIAEAALAACRAWTDGELSDDFAVVVIKRTAA